MNIIYCHHAQRNIKGKATQQDGLTKFGVKDAKLCRELFEQINKRNPIKAIYTSPYFRCTKTAQIVNNHLKLPIIEDARLNEFCQRETGESWTDCQTRITDCLKDIINKYEEKDTVICITSGVNIAAFVNLSLNKSSSENTPFYCIYSCSPIMFSYKKPAKEKQTKKKHT